MQIFGTSMSQKVIDIFNKWEKKGLCNCKDNDCYSLNAEGMLFLNCLLQEIAKTEW